MLEDLEIPACKWARVDVTLARVPVWAWQSAHQPSQLLGAEADGAGTLEQLTRGDARALLVVGQHVGEPDGSHRFARGLIVMLGALCLAAVPSVSTLCAFASTPTRVQATQELVVLLAAHSAHRAPEAGSPQVALVSARTPITGERTTLHVMLAGRPDGLTGWIS
jgi:hypothetical protein